jgi:hypothetical protein
VAAPSTFANYAANKCHDPDTRPRLPYSLLGLLISYCNVQKYESVLSSWTQPSYARPSDTLATGLRGLPENTPMELRAAYMNPWMCDYSLEALLKPVCEKLGEFNARAQGARSQPDA